MKININISPKVGFVLVLVILMAFFAGGGIAVVSHSATQIVPGDFGAIVGATSASNYSFPGNVGIGTTTPNQSLVVIGNATITGNLTVGIGTTTITGSTITTTGTVTGGSFSGAGTGLTGTATSLSIGGNAATATSASSVSCSDCLGASQISEASLNCIAITGSSSLCDGSDATGGVSSPACALCFVSCGGSFPNDQGESKPSGTSSVALGPFTGGCTGGVFVSGTGSVRLCCK